MSTRALLSVRVLSWESFFRFHSPFRRFGEQGGEGLVEGDEVFDAGAFAGKGGGAVGAVYGAVEGGVGFGQAGRHRDGVVEVGECRAGGPMFFSLI